MEEGNVFSKEKNNRIIRKREKERNTPELFITIIFFSLSSCCRRHNFLALDRLPLHAQRANQRQARHGQAHVERLRQRAVVGKDDARQQRGAVGLLEHAVLQLRGADLQYDVRAQARRRLAQARHEPVREDVLPHRHEQRAAERLHKHHHGRARRHVVQRQHRLHGNQRLLQAQADADAVERLVADPLRRRRVHLKRRQQAGANRPDDRRGKHEWRVVSEDRDQAAGQNRHNDDAEHHGNVVDARLHGRHALDRLEPNGYVKDEHLIMTATRGQSSAAHKNPPKSYTGARSQQKWITYEEGSTHCKGVARAKGDAALLDNARRQGCDVPLHKLQDDKGNDENTKQHEERNNARILPAVLGAAPLQRQQQTDNGWDEDSGAVRVKLPQLLEHRQVADLVAARRVEEEGDADDSDGANGQVDVEAPAPRDLVGEDAAQKRAGNRGDSEHGADEARVYGPLAQRHRVGNDDQRAREDARRAEPGDSAADNQRLRVRRRAADERTQLEESNCDKENPFDGEKGVELSEHQLKRAAEP